MVEQHMILLSSGDSFTYGNELSDDSPSRPSSKTWSACLANKLGMEHESVAKGGAGNDYISRALITRASVLRKQNMNFAVAVMWTYPGRIELKVDGEWHQLNDYVFWDSLEKLHAQWPGKGEKFYKTVLDKIQKDNTGGYLTLFRDYMKFTVLNGNYAIVNSYKSIFVTAQYLKHHNIPFFFVNAVDHAMQSQDQKSIDVWPYVDSLDNNDWLPVPSFYEWAKENNYDFGSVHPLDRAHADYADLILETGLVEKWQSK
jgi:hypothetical protein